MYMENSTVRKARRTSSRKGGSRLKPQLSSNRNELTEEKLLAASSAEGSVQETLLINGPQDVPTYLYDASHSNRQGFPLLAGALAERIPHLYQSDKKDELVLIRADGTERRIQKAPDLGALLSDTFHFFTLEKGEKKAKLPSSGVLSTMLKSEMFRDQFQPVRSSTKSLVYRADFTLLPAGYDQGSRMYLHGQPVEGAEGLETIKTFLGHMDFDSEASRTNCLGAALTVLLRHQFPGQNPCILVTADRSHSGKTTVCDFFSGLAGQIQLRYEDKDWPMENSLQKLIKQNPDRGVIVLDNTRVDSAGGQGKMIKSALLESQITAPELNLASATGKDPLCLVNDKIFVINSNHGLFSIDLLNRGLTIHLSPKADVHLKQSLIGNPRLDFLKNNGEQIQRELVGMIDRWREAGCPLDEEAKHSMSRWAKVIGGILKFHGYPDFLKNQDTAKTVMDPIRKALAVLGAARPGEWLRVGEWADLALNEGVIRDLVPAQERNSTKGREREIGSTFSKHLEVGLYHETDDGRMELRLSKQKKRWDGEDPHVRYKFTVVQNEAQTESR